VHGGTRAAGEGDGVDPAELDGDTPPGPVGAAFGNADEQQRQPAQQHVGADAVLESVEHRPQQQAGLQVAEAALGFEQVLVAEGGVFGADVRVGGGDEVLAVEALFGLDLGAVDDQPPVGLLAQPATEGG
jgi:hypothetical protein